MTSMDEKLVLDADGVPILTELVHAHETPASIAQQQDTDGAELSPPDIAASLLQSPFFRQQLDEITAELTRNLHHEVEQSLRPAIEEAISLGLNGCGDHTAAMLRQRLETALPELLARALEK